jgi:hypothetical protein
VVQGAAADAGRPLDPTFSNVEQLREFYSRPWLEIPEQELERKLIPRLTRPVFDRYDVTSEEDRAEASRKLQALAGTVAGAVTQSDAEALKTSLTKSVKPKKLNGGEGQNRTVDTTIFSRMLYQLSYLATPEDRVQHKRTSVLR